LPECPDKYECHGEFRNPCLWYVDTTNHHYDHDESAHHHDYDHDPSAHHHDYDQSAHDHDDQGGHLVLH
jgi:hypothetical protein